MQQRLDYIDFAKAVAIVSVVTGHVMLYDLYGDDVWKTSLMSVIGSYQNNLFMFLSGIVSVTAIEKKDIIRDIYKRFRCLLVPALIVGIIYAYFIGQNATEFFVNKWKLGYWYLFVLFALYILSYPFTFFSNKKMRWLSILLIPVWLFIYRHTYIIPSKINNILDIEFVIKYFPYFFVGNMVKRYGLHERIFTLPVLLLCVAILIFQNSIEEISRNYLMLLHHNTIVHLAEIFVIIIVSKFYCKMSSKTRLYPIVLNVGVNTLYIYIFHYFALQLMSFPSIFEWFVNNGNLIIDIMASIVPVVVAIIFSLLLKKMIEKDHRIMKLIFNRR